ncbi:MAG: polysaccharide deacetylase family protein, partial [Intestinibacter sp.]
RVKAFLNSIILFLIGLILIFALVFCIKAYFNEQSSDIPIHKVDTDKKEISLTFDISYSERNVEQILDVLDKYDVKATFFVVGNWLDKNRALVEEIHKRGHEIENHSNTHPNFNEISESDIKKELESTSKKIKEITGQESRLFRPPFGEIDENRVKVCEALGYKIIKWNVDSMDWKNIDDNNIVDRVARGTSPGSIILFHGDGKNVEYYLDQIIYYFEKNGYNIVKVSDLVYEENYYIDSTGVQRLKQ